MGHGFIAGLPLSQGEQEDLAARPHTGQTLCVEVVSGSSGGNMVVSFDSSTNMALRGD